MINQEDFKMIEDLAQRLGENPNYQLILTNVYTMGQIAGKNEIRAEWMKWIKKRRGEQT